MEELDAATQAAWERAVRRQMARDRLRVRRAALDGRLALYESLLRPLASEPPGHLAQWRAALHLATANELSQRTGVDLLEMFLTDAHDAAIAALWAAP
ncbi:hypothetical protein ADK67_03705 [Saccharothrix sp. NRRL B-16348]|uniref:hypothetical protein n=1 Tax=Saccharothrix sp. NRRL B-16348 TaxID=1415542 RepID=UPI0006C2337E|nr:hypothetical protein [Saccharothrix sp. NRRL B-16348]KOX34389.1 hypothetical protein ADK67_03705 [Saccharothrix sp. NRRL B-16348]